MKRPTIADIARRAGVSTGAKKLRDQGVISYARGWVRIEDRVGLEGRACECYAVMKDEFARLYDGEGRTA